MIHYEMNEKQKIDLFHCYQTAMDVLIEMSKTYNVYIKTFGWYTQTQFYCAIWDEELNEKVEFGFYEFNYSFDIAKETRKRLGYLNG